jgi:hypothetical protein
MDTHHFIQLGRLVAVVVFFFFFVCFFLDNYYQLSAFIFHLLLLLLCRRTSCDLFLLDDFFCFVILSPMFSPRSFINCLTSTLYFLGIRTPSSYLEDNFLAEDDFLFLTGGGEFPLVGCYGGTTLEGFLG